MRRLLSSATWTTCVNASRPGAPITGGGTPEELGKLPAAEVVHANGRDQGVALRAIVLGGQIAGDPPRLFRIYAEGNFIEASVDTPYLQTGETKYGKPIIDRVITRSTSLNDAAKCVLVAFDSTMRSNLSVGMPIDLLCYRRDSLEVQMRRRFDEDDAYFKALGRQWVEGSRQIFSRLPDLDWCP